VLLGQIFKKRSADFFISVLIICPAVIEQLHLTKKNILTAADFKIYYHGQRDVNKKKLANICGSVNLRQQVDEIIQRHGQILDFVISNQDGCSIRGVCVFPVV